MAGVPEASVAFNAAGGRGEDERERERDDCGKCELAQLGLERARADAAANLHGVSFEVGKISTTKRGERLITHLRGSRRRVHDVGPSYHCYPGMASVNHPPAAAVRGSEQSTSPVA